MYASTGNSCQGAAPQVKAIGIVGIGDVQQPLYRLLTQEVHRRRGNFILGRIFASNGSQAFAHGHRDNLDEVKHPLQVTIAISTDIVPDIAAAGAEGAVILIEPVNCGIAQTALSCQILMIIVSCVEQIHCQYHRVFAGLRIDNGNLAVMSQLVQTGKTEGMAAIFRFRQKRPVFAAEKLDKKSFAVTRFSHKHKGHLLAGAAFSSILDIGNETVDLVEHANGVFSATAEQLEVIGGSAIYHHLFKPGPKNHPGHGLKCVFKYPLVIFNRFNMLDQLLMDSHGHPPP